MSASATDGTTAIHDIGYRHYSGPRLGQGYLVRSLILDGVRGAYGIGRAPRSKVMPFILFGLTTMVALIFAVLAATTEAPLELGYSEFGLSLQMLVVIYAAGQAPALVSRDLRHGVMPLYFSRPLRRVNYVLAKLVAMTIALWFFISVGVLVLYAGALLADQPFWSNTGLMARGLLSSLLQALVTAMISLVVAAYLPQRGLGVTIVIAVYLLTQIVANVVAGVAVYNDSTAGQGYALLASPFLLVAAVQHWLFHVDSGIDQYPPGAIGVVTGMTVFVAVLAGCWLALQRRYLKAVAS
jgi:ABC-2 type transport system permease protein